MLGEGNASARLELAVALLIPMMVLCLLSAAACAQPGRDKNCVRRLCDRRDRSTALWTLLIVMLLCVAFTTAGLWLVNAEAERVSALNSTFEIAAAIEVKFCEGKYGSVFGGMRSQPVDKFLPEWGSMCSALFILYCGLHMLIFWVHDSAMLKLIATFFCVNGISSFFYHMTGLKRWLLADGNSMVLLVYMVVAYMYDELVENFMQQYVDAGAKRTARLVHTLYWKTVFRRALSALIWMACLMFAWFWIFGRVTSDAESAASDGVGHVVVFGGALAAILVFGCVIAALRHTARRARRRMMMLEAQRSGPGQGVGGQVARERSTSADPLSQFVQDRVMLGAGVRFAVGLVAAILSASIWIATEALCDRNLFFRVFPGHMVWHLGMTWGLVNCLVYAALLRADNFGQVTELGGALCQTRAACSSFPCRIFGPPLARACTASPHLLSPPPMRTALPLLLVRTHWLTRLWRVSPTGALCLSLPPTPPSLPLVRAVPQVQVLSRLPGHALLCTLTRPRLPRPRGRRPPRLHPPPRASRRAGERLGAAPYRGRRGGGAALGGRRHLQQCERRLGPERSLGRHMGRSGWGARWRRWRRRDGSHAFFGDGARASHQQRRPARCLVLRRRLPSLLLLSVLLLLLRSGRCVP